METQPAGAEAAPWRELVGEVGAQTAGAGAAARRAVEVQCWGRLADLHARYDFGNACQHQGGLIHPLPLRKHVPCTQPQ
jgi:hypothetical protein